MPVAATSCPARHLLCLSAPVAPPAPVMPGVRSACRFWQPGLRALPASPAVLADVSLRQRLAAPLSTWVNQLKFSGTTALRVMLARLLLLSWLNAYRSKRTSRPDLLMCVPLHSRRCWWRGYNQTALLPPPLAHWLGCAFSPALYRRRAGAVQHHLSARQRRRNLRGAFHLEADVTGRHIALIDDVVTTGSTVKEISRLLRAQGAASVHIWCLCRTL